MFIKKIAIYIALSVMVIGGTCYGTGYYIASNKAERDVAAIRAILEKQEADKERAKREEAEAEAKAEADYQEYLRKKEEIYKRWDAEPKKGY